MSPAGPYEEGMRIRLAQGVGKTSGKTVQLQATLEVPFACSPSSYGWCFLSGTSHWMSECQCIQEGGGYHGALRIHGPQMAGTVEWTPSDNGSGHWLAPTTVFAQLCQILADAYAERMGSQQAFDEVIRRLGRLITEAYSAPAPELGTCTLSLTSPPTPIRMTRAQCDKIPGGTWAP